MATLLSKTTAALVAVAAAAAGGPFFPDSTLNVTQIFRSIPESDGVFVGSPSIVRMPDGDLFATHDLFGRCPGGACNSAFGYSSPDNGTTWAPTGGVASPMYWATSFVRPGDSRVYLIGTGSDGNTGGVNQIYISASSDSGRTFLPSSVPLTRSNASYSTGPTPVLAWAGRLWRAFEHNVGPGGWGRGYSSVVISAPLDPAVDLLSPASWSLSAELPFSSVAASVPAGWARPGVTPGYGWLEGGAVEPQSPASSAGISVVLRVNSQPAANKAALLSLAGGEPGAALAFVQWVDPFPGGMTKFDVRRDPATGLYVTLSNNIEDDGVSFPPTCGPVSAPTAALGCCGFISACSGEGWEPSSAALPSSLSAPPPEPSCLWCRAGSRANLTLAVSPSIAGPWTVSSPRILYDDTGLPGFVSLLQTGFQYVSFQFDGNDLIAAVRAGYRGSANYHNANMLLHKRVVGWRALPDVARVLRDMAAAGDEAGGRE